MMESLDKRMTSRSNYGRL